MLLARERDLRHAQRGRLEPAPVRRAAAVGREREATDGDRAPTHPAVRRLVGGVAHSGCRQRAPTVGDRGEAVGAGGLQAADLAETRQGSPAAVRLLEHEPVLAGPARGARDRGGIDVACERQRDRREHLAAGASRAPDRQRQPRGQPLAVLCAQPKGISSRARWTPVAPLRARSQTDRALRSRRL